VLPQISDLRMAGERIFYLWREADARVPVLMVRDPHSGPGQLGPGRVLFDPDSARGEGQHAIDWFVPSPEGRYVACAVSPSGSENSKLQVIDVDGGVILDDIIPPLTAFAFVSWLDDSRSFSTTATTTRRPARRRSSAVSTAHSWSCRRRANG
jgi:prolyl oligopeptidase